MDKWKDLKTEDADERPFAMIFDWKLGSRFSLHLLLDHALVSAFTGAIPFLPPQIERLLQECLIGGIKRHGRWLINTIWIIVYRKLAAIEAAVLYTPTLLAIFHTRPVKISPPSKTPLWCDSKLAGLLING
jgi:hypothetical protein